MVDWFNEADIKIKPEIYLDSLNGYVLPHAGTEYSGKILSNTLRFRPTKKFDYILIIYLPANDKPNMGKKYHEYGVIYNTLKKFNQFKHKKIIGYNIKSPKNLPQNMNNNNTLYVVSADFSHFLPLQEAIKLENCAAHSIMHRNLDTYCSKVIDHAKSFRFLYKKIPQNWVLQWIGRTRSPGEKGVGYLSFLIRSPPNISIKPFKIPNGFFITAYDKNMKARECLGNIKMWSKKLETNLLKDVLHKASTTSRLTGGDSIEIPITNYTITYLYRDYRKFIRGWHAILKDALYLPDVFLENTYENGKWMKNTDYEWPTVINKTRFYLKHTFKKLESKAGKYNKTRKNRREKATIFNSEVYHGKV